MFPVIDVIEAASTPRDREAALRQGKPCYYKAL
jgi:hypothetical protein